MLRELWRYRKYIWGNAVADLSNRYAGSLLGVFWNVFQPLFQIIIFTFIFSQVMISKMPGLDSTTEFAIYLCAGILPWGLFSETIIRGSNSFIDNSTYLKKLPVPEHIFIAQVVVSSAILLSISMILLLIVVFLIGGAVSTSWLLLPPLLMLLLIFGYGITLMFGSINVFFRDIGQFLGTLLQVWMWMTPIVYLKQIVPITFQDVFKYNPAYWFVDSLHDIIVFSHVPPFKTWLILSLISFVSFTIGCLVLQKLRNEIRDVL